MIDAWFRSIKWKFVVQITTKPVLIQSTKLRFVVFLSAVS